MISDRTAIQARHLVRRGIKAAEAEFSAPSHAARVVIHGDSWSLHFDPENRVMVVGEVFASALVRSARRPRFRAVPDPEPVHALLGEAIRSLMDPASFTGLAAADLALQAEHAAAHLPHVRVAAAGLAELGLAAHHRHLLQRFAVPHLVDVPAPPPQHPAAMEAMREVMREGASILGIAQRDLLDDLVRSGMGYWPLVKLSTMIHQRRGTALLGDHEAQHELLDVLTRGLARVQYHDTPELPATRRRSVGTTIGRDTMVAVHRIVRQRGLSLHGGTDLTAHDGRGIG